MKQFTVAIIGCGSRGCNAYGNLMHAEPDRFKVVALCDIDEQKLSRYSELYNIPKQNIFTSETEFFKKKLADVLVLATQDKDHVRMCIRAFELGYDVLLEKPISPSLDELNQLLIAHKKYNKHVLVCHVLRYAPAYLKIKELLDSGVIGNLVRFEATENVTWWHQAHSFVRGNWRNEEQTSPMILSKSCHDLDLIQWYAGAKCKSVYSTGDLAFFKKENQPKDASDNCIDCKYNSTCQYSAENLYVKRFKANNNCQGWPYNIVDSSKVITEESLRKAYSQNGYGKCVFNCDNDVVDNQMVEMTFENGVKASLVMTAFCAFEGRHYVFHGANGEIEFHEFEKYIRVSVYGEKPQIISIPELLKNSKNTGFGHGGGDHGIVDSFYNVLIGNETESTSLENSVESHLIALCAEKSRKSNKVEYVREVK